MVNSGTDTLTPGNQTRREKLRAVAEAVKHEITVYGLVLRDRRTPWPAKALPALAVGYVLLPFDIIPDFIPVIGHLDDLVHRADSGDTGDEDDTE